MIINIIKIYDKIYFSFGNLLNLNLNEIINLKYWEKLY